MENSQYFFTSGYEEYKKDNISEAGSLFRLATRAAEEEGDIVFRHKCLFWEGNCLARIGHIHLAMTRYLEMRVLENDRRDLGFSQRESWFARAGYFICLLTNPKNLEQLKEMLEELEEYARRHVSPAYDLFMLRAMLSYQRGDWHEVLAISESMLSEFTAGAGYQINSALLECSRAALRLRKLVVARDWIEALSSYYPSGSKQSRRIYLDLALISLARAENDIEKLRLHLSSLNSLPPTVDAAQELRRMAKFWGALLDRDAGDPAARDHPARRALSRAPKTSEDMNKLFEYALAILDYRLACLRFAVGLHPNDDQWHPAETPSRLRPSGLDGALRRLSRARTAAHGAMRRALYLDRAFECGWREADVEKRTIAIKAISKALEAGCQLHSHRATDPKKNSRIDR